MVKKWEYKILSSHGRGSEATLNQLGDEGWELVACKIYHNPLSDMAVFKGEKC